MAPSERPERRSIKGDTYGFFLLLFGLLEFLTHLPLITLPYFWDEATQFIPSALDIFHNGWWIPHSVAPLAHPPAVMGYLAAMWEILGYHTAVTRGAMLVLASFSLLAAFLLAIELARECPGKPAFLAAGLLLVSPVFFAQAMIAQLDAPAMLFTTVALLLFLQDRIRLSAAACVALVMVKETGILVPGIFMLWLVCERRWRDAVPYLLPALALAGWFLALRQATGTVMGNAGYEAYNLYYPLHPVRLSMALFRRFYYLCVANFHWVGFLAILYAWRKSKLFRSRSWKVAWTLTAAQILMVSALGGATLERYLLPVMPVIYAAMAAGIALLPVIPRRVATVVLAAGVAAANYINPPYPFPYEDNLAFADFIKLQMDAADYIEHWYPAARVYSAWPFTMEIEHPELGYVNSRFNDVRQMRNFGTAAVAAVNWNDVEVFVAFPRTWDPDLNLIHVPAIRSFWRRYFIFNPNLPLRELRAAVPLPVEQHFERRGQWIEIFVNPKTRQTTAPGSYRASVETRSGHR